VEVPLNRRHILSMGALSMAPFGVNACSSAPAGAEPVMSSIPADPFATYLKMVGSLASSTVYFTLEGELWGVAPDRPPEAICGFSGLARSDWLRLNENTFRKHSFDLGFFSDLQTRQRATTIVNPITKDMVQPFDFKYGGSETTISRETYDEEPPGTWSTAGRERNFTEKRKGSFPTPFPPSEWPRESAGETYHASSETNYLAEVCELEDPTISAAKSMFFWTAFLSWEPWLLMDGAPGFVMWRGIGNKFLNADEVPSKIRDYALKTQPNYFNAAKPWTGRKSTYASFRELRSPAAPSLPVEYPPERID